MTTQIRLPADHSVTKLFDKRNKDIPNLGTNSPNLGTNSPNLGTAPDFDPLVDNYPEEIHHRIVYAAMQCGSHMREGWNELVLELDEDISKIYPLYTIDQVKEKFGGLRYYIGILPDILPQDQHDEIHKLIAIAEEKSFTICDVCGEPGTTMRVGEWLIATRCEKHGNKEA